MNKYFGLVGFAVTEETSPGIYEETITEREYYGDISRNTRKLEGSNVNDNINITNDISIVADPYANENFYAIRYATFAGSKWKVSSVEVNYPRLTLTLGGLYNG